MTRLDYMRLTPGQRRDVRDHLKASGYGLGNVPATFDDFLAPHIGGHVRTSGSRAGTVRSQNHHGIDPDNLKQGFVISEAERGLTRRYCTSATPKYKLADVRNLFKPRLAGE